MERAGVTSAVAIDWTRCFDYERLVAEELQTFTEFERTADLKIGGIAANGAWLRWYQYLAEVWQTDFLSMIVEAAAGFERPRLLSLGCGFGGLELDLARRLGGSCEILGLDLNEQVFATARQVAQSEGLPLAFQALDLNFVELAESAFDVVFAHASLHHLLNLEHLFAQVHRTLRPGGRLVVLDLIGKSQVLFWPDNVRFACDLVARMPERYRGALPADPVALFGGYLDGAEQEGMEGIRQAELEAQLDLWFSPLRRFRYCSFVRLICTHPQIAPRFDPARDDDQAYLDALFRLDQEQVEAGTLRPTELFAVYEGKPAAEVAASPLGGWARPEGARKVSVLVACDGSAGELRRCFASVQAQTHRNLEVVLAAAAEGDAARLAGELAAGHPHVRRVESAASALTDWRPALAAATGEFVACLSSRDAWHPVKLAEQLALLERRPEAALAYAPASVVDDRGRITSRAFGTDVVGEDLSTEALERLIAGAEIPRSTALFRRDAWRRAQPAGGHAVTDLDLCLRLAAAAPVAFDPRPLSVLRAPSPAAPEAPEPQRRHRQEALARLRHHPGPTGRATEPAIRAALDLRIAALAPPQPELPERPPHALAAAGQTALGLLRRTLSGSRRRLRRAISSSLAHARQGLAVPW